MALTQDGFIYIWRSFKRTSFFKKPLVAHLAVYLLLDVNHETYSFIFNSQEITVKPGQTVTGIHELSKSSGLSIQNARTALKILKKIGFLTIKSTNRYSIITLCNFNNYQKGGEHFNNLSNKPLTNKQQATNKQLTTNNNDNNDKNDKKGAKKLAPGPLSFFCKEYENALSLEYIPTFAKDNKIFKDLQTVIKGEELKKLIKEFFISSDPFIKESGYTVGAFKSQINKLRKGVAKGGSIIEKYI